MDLRIGLNPYGLTYHLGIQGVGTPRANPKAAGLDGYLALASELDARTLELWEGWTGKMTDGELTALGRRLAEAGIEPVGSVSLQTADFANSIRIATRSGQKVVRVALTPVLCGDRNIAAGGWQLVVDTTWRKLVELATLAAKEAIELAIENHQDFTSAELVRFCREAGRNIGITLDTANAFGVGESPIAFADTVAPHVRYLHLKDYQVQFTAEGYRLIRCPVGEGAVPFKEVLTSLGRHHEALPAAIEIGALEARHVRLFTPDWWHGYPPKEAPALAAALLAAQRNRLADGADYRTPWETRADGDTLIDFELAQMRASAANVRALGLTSQRS